MLPEVDEKGRKKICKELRRVERGVKAIRQSLKRYPVACAAPEVLSSLMLEAAGRLMAAAKEVGEI
jgi:hypothetical protein